MKEVEGFVHTMLMVLLSIAVYNVLVRQFTPTPIQTWIGI
jgi:hypothetical protein